MDCRSGFAVFAIRDRDRATDVGHAERTAESEKDQAAATQQTLGEREEDRIYSSGYGGDFA